MDGTVPQPSLSPREIYQVLRDLALSTRVMRRRDQHASTTISCDLVTVEVDGWVLTFYKHCDALGLCESGHAPDGRSYILDASQRYGTNPVELLSTWEHQQLENMLKAM